MTSCTYKEDAYYFTPTPSRILQFLPSSRSQQRQSGAADLKVTPQMVKNKLRSQQSVRLVCSNYQKKTGNI